ncbi:PP2C family protein-serine/threonine phosphatase [Streptomyces sp. 4N509B]|uniref:PP2C family protein-serine/threonine phosphatase n=1 Tax=Streptomyces sp. 4N509B TaxID=3457413 RepID=UPI003FD4A610
MTGDDASGVDEATRAARAAWIGAVGGPLLPRWLRVVPVALFVVVGALTPVAPRWLQVATLLAALPPMAGLLYGPLVTALFGAAVLVALSQPTTEPHVSGGDLAAVAVMSSFGVVVAWFRSRYTRNLVVFRSVAEAAQRAVLPPLPPRVGSGPGAVRCAALYRPALRPALVGGDLYDVRDGPHGVRVLVGDVRGHGVEAVGTVASLLGAFREAVLDEPDLGGVAGRLMRRLAVDARRNRSRGEEVDTELFATAVLLEVARDGRAVRVASLGHPPPLLLSDGRTRELAPPPAPPLGVVSPGVALSAMAAPLRPGDVLLAYTDGVTEARDSNGAFFPLLERLAARPWEGEATAASRPGAGYGRWPSDRWPGRRAGPRSGSGSAAGAPAAAWSGPPRPPEPAALVASVGRELSAFAPKLADDVTLLAILPEAAPGA